MPPIRRNRSPRPETAAPEPETVLDHLLEKHLADLRVRGYSEFTVKNRRVHVGFFLAWCRSAASPIRTR
jgi:integrase/recombinase XerD